jgi:hypothetical protein
VRNDGHRTPFWRRLIPAAIAILLVVGPGGYLAQSAARSHDIAAVRLDTAVRRGTVRARPPAKRLKVYVVPIPLGATDVGYHEANSWRSSSFYAQFTTTPNGLDAFLAGLGSGRRALVEGRVTVTAAQARSAGWDIGPHHHWAGVSLRAPGPAPDHEVTVNLDHSEAPVVDVVSTVTFR